MTSIDSRPATAVPAPPEPDPDRLMGFVHRAVGEVGAALNAGLVVIGDRLGYYRDLAAHGPTTPGDLAERTGTDEHYTREWLNAQAAGEFVSYDPATGRYTLPPEQAIALADESSPAFVAGLFQIAHGTLRDAPAVLDAARTGDGIGWHEHNSDVHAGCERFFAPTYAANLLQEWLPALDGAVTRLQGGAQVADIGCGHGASTILMAGAFPSSTFVGLDYHAQSIATATERARSSGLTTNLRFEVGDAARLPGAGYDLVTMFDCLHDMGDPVGAARHVREVIAPDGIWMVVEPAAGDRVEDNLNPVGRAYYCFSTLLCTPASLSQEVGLALGTQAGPARIRDVAQAAGFTRFRIVAQTPFNNVFEIRP